MSNLPFPSLLPTQSSPESQPPADGRIVSSLPQDAAPLHFYGHDQGHDDHGHAHHDHDHDHDHEGHDHGDHGHAHDSHGHSHHGHSHGPSSSSSSYSTHTTSGNAANGNASERLTGFGASYDPPPPPPDRKRGPSLWARYERLLNSDGDARRVVLYITVKVGFMLIQMLSGLLRQKLGLVSAAFHTAFDGAALCVSVGAMVLAKRPPSSAFSYGFERLEVMAGFVNATFLIFSATFMIMEGIHQLYKSQEIHSESVLLAVVGLVVDGVGLALFHRYSALRAPLPLDAPQAHQVQYLGDRGRDANLHGVWLHVVADVMAHLGLLLASWLSQWPDWRIGPYGVVFTSVSLIMIRVSLPLFLQTGAILLQTTPPQVRTGIERGLREISFHDGVLECRSAHWWQLAPGITVGSLHIRVRSDADEDTLLIDVTNLLKKYITHLTVQIEKDLPVNWMMNSAGGGVGT